MHSDRKRLLKWPSLRQWLQINKLLSKKEKLSFISFFALFLFSLIYLSHSFYFKHTEIAPATGGEFREGIIGQPEHINPIYSPINDVDKDITELIYSGLMRYTPEGKIVPDLAKECRELSKGTVFECYLKDNVFFHDGKKVTADDVIFTVKTIQNPDSKSPLRANWLGVKVEKISEKGVRFKLKQAYAPFLERLTLKILPSHIWKGQNFSLSIYNLHPIGSGPYQFKNLTQDKSGAITSFRLKSFRGYYGKKPYIPQISFVFFKKENNLIEALKKGKIDGYLLTPSSTKNYSIAEKTKINILSFPSPRYFAVFFNPSRNKFLAEKKIRQALIYGTDRKKIIKQILPNKEGIPFGKIVNSPILPEIYHYDPPSKIYKFDPEQSYLLFKEAGFTKKEGKMVKIIKAERMNFASDLKYGSRGADVKNLQKCLANIGTEVYPEGKITGFFGADTKKAVIRFQEKYAAEILKPYGLKKGTGQVREGTRSKLNEVCLISPEKTIPIKISITTVEDKLLKQTAQLLKEQWEKLGIQVDIKIASINNIKEDIIKKRDYEALLFGEALGEIPDPFPFWHSSQRIDPGLNLADYKNKTADKLLEQGRTEMSLDARAKKYEKFQDILIESAPCEFLYNPDYIYLMSSMIKGIKTGVIITPSGRFNDISNWYIKTHRVWKL